MVRANLNLPQLRARWRFLGDYTVKFTVNTQIIGKIVDTNLDIPILYPEFDSRCDRDPNNPDAYAALNLGSINDYSASTVTDRFLTSPPLTSLLITSPPPLKPS
jgi:hypothetical protein